LWNKEKLCQQNQYLIKAQLADFDEKEKQKKEAEAE